MWQAGRGLGVPLLHVHTSLSVSAFCLAATTGPEVGKGQCVRGRGWAQQAEGWQSRRLQMLLQVAVFPSNSAGFPLTYQLPVTQNHVSAAIRARAQQEWVLLAFSIGETPWGMGCPAWPLLIPGTRCCSARLWEQGDTAPGCPSCTPAGRVPF